MFLTTNKFDVKQSNLKLFSNLISSVSDNDTTLAGLALFASVPNVEAEQSSMMSMVK